MSSNGHKFKKGALIHSEKPFVYILSAKYRTERCDFCFKRCHVMKCSGCAFSHYCDRDCQKQAWSWHKVECRNIRRVAPKVVPDAARLLARIIIKLKQGGAHERGFYSSTGFRVFKDLMSHYAEMKEDTARIEHFTSLSAVISEFLRDETLPNSIEFLGMYGRMVVNSFNILDNEMQSIGSGIYLGASIMDHSCVPNAIAVFDGTTLNVRTLKDLKTLDWSKVFISYIDLLNTAAIRQKELQSSYWFLCQCPRCLDIEELNLMTSTICQNEDCRKCVMGGAKKEYEHCEHCGEVVSSKTWKQVTEVSEFTNQQLQIMKDVAYLDICRMCLLKQEGLLHPLNLHRVKVVDLAMDSCIAMSAWDSALEYGQMLLEPFRRYYGELHPICGIHLMKLGKISLYLERMSEGKQWLLEAASIIKITHGVDHPLFKNELYHLLKQCT